jgi:hypothetical protein
MEIDKLLAKCYPENSIIFLVNFLQIDLDAHVLKVLYGCHGVGKRSLVEKFTCNLLRVEDILLETSVLEHPHTFRGIKVLFDIEGVVKGE